MNRPAPAPEIAGHTYAKHINSGGFADVYLYTQKFPARDVAIKVLRPLPDAATATEQFEAEANVMAQLSGHPSIVEIYSAGRSADGRSYIAMEFCPPPALVDRYRIERLPVEEVLDIGIRIASAVETAHRAGILHRDIKPHNILRGAYGSPKLTDFGIAGLTGGDGGGEDGSSYGMSIPWASPETLREEAGADPRSDVFSLAATLYSLLAQRSPFEIPGAANDDATLISRIERQPLAPLRRADVPDTLNDLIACAMAKRPDDRPHSALALAQGLQDVQTQLGGAPTPIEVFDASPEAGEQIEDRGGTRIRPVKIVLPEEIAERGTRLRPKIVRPPVVEDRTRQRPPAPQTSDTVARPRPVAEPAPDAAAGGGRRAQCRWDRCARRDDEGARGRAGGGGSGRSRRYRAAERRQPQEPRERAWVGTRPGPAVGGAGGIRPDADGLRRACRRRRGSLHVGRRRTAPGRPLRLQVHRR